MNKYKTRNEIPNCYKWDLDTIYKNDKEYQDDINKFEDLLEDFKKYQGKVNNPNTLYDAIKDYYDLYRLLIKIYSYSKLTYDIDKSIPKSINMEKKSSNLYANFGIVTSFLTNEIKDIKNIDKFYQDNKKLEEYKFQINDILRSKKHILSLKEELILSNTSIVRNASYGIFSDLASTDLDYGKITMPDKIKVELTNSLLNQIKTGFDRNLRKKAFKMEQGYYEKFKNTFANILLTNVKNDNNMALIRKYNSALEASLDNDNISVEVYDNLISSVNRNMDKLHRYIKLKKNASGLKDFSIYDIYVPMNKENNKKYTYEEASEIVRNALSILGEEYYSIACNAFNDNWFDVYETKSKTTGAYSGGSYDSKPYILLNFAGTQNDIETIAHELGHSMHTYFSNKYNNFEKSDYPIFLAEIASNVNEILLANYQLSICKTNNDKKDILESLLDGFKSSIYRQTQFAEFEQIIHEKDQNNEELSIKEITDVYYDLNKKYYGNEIILNDLIRYECLRVPHFYYNFYVYKYATGLSIAHIFASRIINHEKNAVENYLDFLKSGGRDYPLEVLKKSNIDLTDSHVFDEALELFDKYMNEYENLSEEK